MCQFEQSVLPLFREIAVVRVWANASGKATNVRPSNKSEKEKRREDYRKEKKDEWFLVSVREGVEEGVLGGG